MADKLLAEIEFPTYDRASGVFRAPKVPAVISLEPHGLNVVLGWIDGETSAAASVFIERREDGWAIVITPPFTDDTAGIVHIRDDGGVSVDGIL